MRLIDHLHRMMTRLFGRVILTLPKDPARIRPEDLKALTDSLVEGTGNTLAVVYLETDLREHTFGATGISTSAVERAEEMVEVIRGVKTLYEVEDD